MFRIGVVGWLIRLSRKSAYGRTSFKVELQTEAKTYRLPQVHQKLLDIEIVNVSPSPTMTQEETDSYPLPAIKEILIWRRLADEAATKNLYDVFNLNLIDLYISFNNARQCLVDEIMQYVKHGKSDDFETQIDLIDLMSDELSEDVNIENGRLRARAVIAHARDMKERKALGKLYDARQRQKQIDASRTAFDLLTSRLNPEEVQQIQDYDVVVVSNSTGDWIVPLDGGLVHRYKDRQFVASYCIQPAYSVPVFDSILYKVIMLKKSTRQFLSIANPSSHEDKRIKSLLDRLLPLATMGT